MKKDVRHQIRRHHLFALLLAAGLFGFHTGVLFELAFYAVRFHATLLQQTNPHIAGITIILGCFLVLFIAHCTEAAAWGLFFWRQGLITDFQESYYFALTSITALGYGDVLLPHHYRLLGAFTAVNGLLMFGCSTAFLFLIIQKIWLVEF